MSQSHKEKNLHGGPDAWFRAYAVLLVVFVRQGRPDTILQDGPDAGFRALLVLLERSTKVARCGVLSVVPDLICVYVLKFGPGETSQHIDSHKTLPVFLAHGLAYGIQSPREWWWCGCKWKVFSVLFLSLVCAP